MSIEDTILNGSNDELDDAMNAPDCLVVDRGSEEPEVLGEIARLLPGFSFSHRYDSEGTCHVTASFRDRTTSHQYFNTPYNCFRIVRDVQALIQPLAFIRVYAPTTGSTTHVFVVRDSNFWKRFDREATRERAQLFEGIDFLDAAWELTPPTKIERQWWQFWK